MMLKVTCRIAQGAAGESAGLRAMIGRRFDLDFVFEQVYRCLGDTAGVVVGVGANSKRACDWEPSRDASSDRAMCDADADFPCNRL